MRKKGHYLVVVEAGVLVGYGPDSFDMGKQAARLADQILKGTDASTLPVEESDASLGINLQTAQAIGIEIPDEILQQARQVIRIESQ